MASTPAAAGGGAGSARAAGPARSGVVRAVRLVSSVLVGLGMLAVAVMLVNTVLDVALRYTLSRPVRGTLEYVTYYYIIAIAFMGLFLAQQRREHIEVTVLVDRLPRSTRWLLELAGNLLALVFLAALAWYGLESALRNAEQGEVGGATQVAIWPARFLVPIGCAAYAVQLVLDTIEEFRRHEPEPGRDPVGGAAA